MTTRSLHGARNNTPFDLRFVRVGGAAAAWTLPTRSGLAFPGGAIALPTAGGDVDLERARCELTHEQGARVRFCFWIAAATAAFDGWTFGGFTVYDGRAVPWGGNAVHGGFPRTFRRLEPYPSGPTPPADVYLWVTGHRDDGTDLRVSILPGAM